MANSYRTCRRMKPLQGKQRQAYLLASFHEAEGALLHEWAEQIQPCRTLNEGVAIPEAVVAASSDAVTGMLNLVLSIDESQRLRQLLLAYVSNAALRRELDGLVAKKISRAGVSR